MKTMKFKQTLLWVAALAIGAVLGSLGIARLDNFFDFVINIYRALRQNIYRNT